MDHLLRNPEAGAACGPSLQPFFIVQQLYFLHCEAAAQHLIVKSLCEKFVGPPTRQLGSFLLDEPMLLLR